MAYGNTLQSMLDTDGDFARLSKDGKLLWHTICVTSLGGKAGFIARKDFAILARQAGLTEAELEAAIDECIANQSVIANGEYIWIRTRVKHRCNSKGWRTAAYKESLEFVSKCPALAEMCIAVHGLTLSGERLSPEVIAANVKRLGTPDEILAKYAIAAEVQG